MNMGAVMTKSIVYGKINIVLILYVRLFVRVVSSYVFLVFTGLSSNTQFEVNLLLQLFLAFGRFCGVALRQNWQLLQDFGKDYFLSERHFKEFFAFKMQTILYWHVYCNQYIEKTCKTMLLESTQFAFSLPSLQTLG